MLSDREREILARLDAEMTPRAVPVIKRAPDATSDGSPPAPCICAVAAVQACYRRMTRRARIVVSIPVGLALVLLLAGAPGAAVAVWLATAIGWSLWWWWPALVAGTDARSAWSWDADPVHQAPDHARQKEQS